jgi:hypothetical protein
MSCGPGGSGHGAGKAPVGEEAKATVTLNRPSSDKPPDATSGYDGFAGTFVQALGPPEGPDPTEACSDHFLHGKATAEPSAQ